MLWSETNSETFYWAWKTKSLEEDLRKIYAGKKKAIFNWNRQGAYYSKEWLKEILDSKGPCYNGNQSDNDDKSSNENNAHH